MERYKISKFDFEKNEPISEVEFFGDNTKAFPKVKDDTLNQKIKAIRELILSIDYKRDCDSDETQYDHAICSILDAIGLSMIFENGFSDEKSTISTVKMFVDNVAEDQHKQIFRGVFTNINVED